MRKSQAQKANFIEVARKAGCDESETAFASELHRIAKAAPRKLKTKGSK
jgi:hypothetical protein